MERGVVFAGPVVADRHAGRRLGHGRLLHQVDLHPPEKPHELVPTLLCQPPAALVDNVHVETGELVLAGPLLRPVEQAGADAESARLGMDTRLVGEVCDVSLSVGPRLPDELVIAERDPPVCREPGLVHCPPLARLVAREPDRVVLGEVGAVSRKEQRGDAVCIVQRRSAYNDILHLGRPAYPWIGWPPMKAFQGEQRLRTEGRLAVRDITDEVADAVRESGVRDGIACVYSPHTTCCVRVNEFENGFLEDFAALLQRLVPSEGYYAHDDWDRRTENICEEDMERGNGHAHCMSMLLGSAGESIPIRDGELCLGTWQRVLFLELDRERDRRWLVQVVGS
jgi:secondary thiamine-phosphate synthase enzyme